MRTPLRVAGRVALAAALALVTATCTEQPTEPGILRSATVRFAPVFPSNTFVAGLPIDNVTVTVIRPAADTIAVKNFPFALTDSVVDLALSVELAAPSETLLVDVELQHGAGILFHGSDTVVVTAGDAGAPIPSITMQYVGPGASIAFLSVLPRDTVLRFGDSLFFSATASDSFEAPVASFYLRWYTSPAGTPIRSDGRIVAPNTRGTVLVHAWTPSGAQDSTTLTFVPVPTQILKVGGDLQSDTAGDTLTTAFLVQVKAADNLPVAGVPVTFAAVTSLGSVLTTATVTDSLGHASSVGVLGDSAKVYSYTATVTGLAPVTFTAQANAGAPALIAIVSGNDQSDTAGKTLANPLVVQVADINHNPILGVPVVWTRTLGTGSPALDTVLSNGAGKSQLLWTLGAPGIDSIRAQIAGTGAFVEFAETAILGGVQVVPISGDLQVDTVGRVLPNSLVVEVQPAGGGAGIAGVPVVWSVTAGLGLFSNDTVVSDSLGRAAVVFAFDTVAGPVTVQAGAVGGGSAAVFHQTGVAGPAHHLAFVVAPPDTTADGAALVPQPVIQVRDTFNNPILHAGFVVRAFTSSMVGAPKPKGLMAGGIAFSASTSGTDSAVTDSTGTAAFSGLAMVGTVGPETYNFQVDSVAVPTLFQPFTLIAGAPSTAILYDGTGQAALIDSLVAVAPQVLVIDGDGNPVAGVQVVFVPRNGSSITGDTVVTDAAGLARVGSWRMGPTPGTDSLEVQVAGVPLAVFTATALPPAPMISLSLLGTSVVGVGRTATLKVALSSPDTTGVVVTLFSDNPGAVALDSGTATYGPVDTTRFRILNGVSVGTANIIATAPGYIPDTLLVTGSLNLITLPTTQNVPLGQTASLPVQLAQPAPAGGVVVNITSLDPTKVGVVTPTVTFNAGEQLKNATVSGVAIGAAAVVADNPNFAPDTSLVSTTAALNITATTLSAFSTFGAQFTTEFRSNGNLTPAPTGGITVTLTPRDPTCVAAPATILIPAGQTSTSDSLDYGGSATLPCVTYLVASAPGIDADSVQVTMNAPPPLNINFTAVTLGSGMQDGSYNVSLGTAAHGGRVLTVRSLTPGLVLIQPDGTTSGTDSITTFVPNGTSNASFFLGALEGVANDSGYVVATMPGFQPDTGKVYVRQGAIDLQGVPSSVNELAGNSSIYVQMGVPNVAQTAMQSYQGPRAGGTMSRLATFQIDSGAIAQFKDSTAVEGIVSSTTFPFGQYYTPLSGPPTGVQVDPAGVGTATVTATVPGLLSLPLATRTMTVTPKQISFSNVSVDVGAGLQDGAYNISLSGPVHPTDTISIRVLTPLIGYVQVNGTTVGVDSIGVAIPSGQTAGSFYLSGAEGVVNDSVLVLASIPGFVPDTLKLRVRQPGIDLQGVPPSPNSLAANSNIYVQLGIPNVAGTAMQTYQGPRFGGTMLRTATVSVTPGAVATLHDSSATADSTKAVDFPVGQYYTPLSGPPTGLSVDPLAPGIAVVTAALPGALALPLATRSMSVTGPVLSFSNAAVDLGSGLQDGAYNLNLGASAHGGVTVLFQVLDTTKAFVQRNGTTAGTDTIQVFVPNGTSNTSFFLAGHEGIVNDSTQVIASVPGFGPDTLWVRVRRAAMDLQGVPATTTVLSNTTSIYAQLGVPNVAGTAMQTYQGTRFGQPAESVWIRSNFPAIARIVDSSRTGDSLQIAWPVGQYYTPLSIGSGGLGVDPLTTGTDTVTLVHPVFFKLPLATREMIVGTPAVTLTGATVGSGLQRSQNFFLGAPAPVGDTVIVKSTAPGILKVAPNGTTPGTDSIVIVLTGGQTSVGYYVQGMEDTTGTPSVDVRAVGFTNGSAGFTVTTPAIDLQGVPSNPSAAATNSAIYGQIGVPNGAHTAMQEYQELRAGAPGSVTATFSNSTPGIAQLVTTSLTADIVTALFTTTYYTPLSKATGGVEFDPLTQGATTITVSAPGFLQLPLATRSVTVGP